jgi:hypothetical protein
LFQLNTPLGRFRYKDVAVNAQQGAASQIVVNQLRTVLDSLSWEGDTKRNSAIKSTLVAQLTDGVQLPPGLLHKHLHLTPTYCAHSRFQHRASLKLGVVPLFYTKYKPGSSKKVNKHLEGALVGWFLGDTASAMITYADGDLAHRVTKHYTFTEGDDTEDITHINSGADRKTVSLDYKHGEVEQLLFARYPALLRKIEKAVKKAFLEVESSKAGSKGHLH